MKKLPFISSLFILSLMNVLGCKGPQGAQGPQGEPTAWANLRVGGAASGHLTAAGACSVGSTVSCNAQSVTDGSGLFIPSVACDNGQFSTTTTNPCFATQVYIIACWVFPTGGTVPGTMGQSILAAEC